MIKQSIKSVLHWLGYEIRRIEPKPKYALPARTAEGPPRADAIWPLPRKKDGPSDHEIRGLFGRFELWHYSYAFEGGLQFRSRHIDAGALTDEPARPLQRFRHFMPYVIEAAGSSLRGKRVLDIACNSGFWSMQCALLGADVVGFDARQELIDQANALKAIVGVENVQYHVLDFWSMAPEQLGGTFDVVLNLGILYHLPEPLAALKLTKRMSRDVVLLDTAVAASPEPVVRLSWENSDDIRAAFDHGMVAHPSKGAVEMMLRHLRVKSFLEIPLRSDDMPMDYLTHNRASWLVRV
jgi:SAM-dependent methyltransferase